MLQFEWMIAVDSFGAHYGPIVALKFRRWIGRIERYEIVRFSIDFQDSDCFSLRESRDHVDWGVLWAESRFCKNEFTLVGTEGSQQVDHQRLKKERKESAPTMEIVKSKINGQICWMEKEQHEGNHQGKAIEREPTL